MEIDVEIKGGRQLEENLKKLSAELAQKYVMKGLREAGKIVAEDARRRAPVYQGKSRVYRSKKSGRVFYVLPGLLKRSISVARMRGDNKRVFVGVFGRRYKLDPAGPEDIKSIKLSAFYAHMVEFGSKNNPEKKPFLNPAFDAKKGEAMQRFGNVVWKQMENYAKKLKKV